MLRMVGAALRLSIYLSVSRAEVLLMTSNTIILNDYDTALVLNSISMFCLPFVII
jgi:hypothetical protein